MELVGDESIFSSALLRVWGGSDAALGSGSQMNLDCRSASLHTQSSRDLSSSSSSPDRRPTLRFLGDFRCVDAVVGKHVLPLPLDQAET